MRTSGEGMSQHGKGAWEPAYASILAAAGATPALQAQALYRLLHDAPEEALVSAHAAGARGREHALLTAAVAYCLGYELQAAGVAVDPDALRLAALAHDLALPPAACNLLPAPVPRWLANRRLFFDALPGSPFLLSAFNSTAEQVLYAAHLVAALPLPIPANRPAAQAFTAHPLGRGHTLAGLALVAGGVLRGEEYVFESARLPEIRGASRLLDSISRVDIPALFGAEFDTPAEAARAEQVRAWFAARTGGARLRAPECLLYAAGGQVLALAPASLAEALRAAIEALYTEQTLVVQSAAVARPCDLLELQYGRQPTRFWVQESAAVRAEEELRLLLAHNGATGESAEVESFPPGKGFGELVEEIELTLRRRGEEWASYPNWETIPYARRCTACDLRGACYLHGADEALCAPCWRKRQAGAAGEAGGAPPGGMEGWEAWHYGRSWPERFVAYLEAAGAESPYARARPADGWETVALPRTVDDIAAASVPAGYLGMIYADGDGVGARLTALRGPDEYRAFSRRLAEATEQAVYTALARHLRPYWHARRWQHPFEIVRLGGDDALLVVPGSVALALAATLARAFQERFPLATRPGMDPWAAQRYRPPALQRGGARPEPADEAPQPPCPVELGMSAGVLVAPAHIPLTWLRDLAAQLLQSAKRASWEARAHPYRRGWCDFWVVHGPELPAARLADWRAGQIRRLRAERRELRLTAAPYTWPELQGLLATARQLAAAGVSRAALQALSALLPHGEAAAGVEYLYWRARLAPEAARLVAAHLESAWRGAEGGGRASTPPWRRLPAREGWERRETILPDLLAVWDFSGVQLAAEAAHAAR
ncbi:MAG TPA: hypothetical protein VFB73_03465 [Chloroflexota bacterium]|nr:hypothetical protein [Chloroflexota bacterium]